jgi:chitinase
MMKKCKIFTVLWALFLPFSGHASLTLYTTSWSMYGTNPYEYDGAYKIGEPYGKLKKVSNPDMVAQFNKAEVVVWSFFQVWNNKDRNQAQFGVKSEWNGLLHFSDLWAELPLEGSWISPLPPETQDFLNFCNSQPKGTCSSVQINGNTNSKELFDYTAQNGVGQLNSFGAFIHSDKYTAKRIIGIGGANTVENQGVSTATFDAIFANQDKFLTQFQGWMKHFKNLKGIDYDFEPPIDLNTGGQLVPDARTVKDYQNLFNLVKASRNKLGKDAYISVTITVDKEYLEMINKSVDGGWFKEIAPFVDSVNLMTYDLHGPWSHDGDPYTAVHTYLKQPESARKDAFGINYGIDWITDKVLGFGMPKEKLQVGLAAYGRGFSHVEAGDDQNYPGFEQEWKGPSHFDKEYSLQEGMVPYKAIHLIKEKLNYSSYLLKALDAQNQSQVIGSYLYSKEAKQFVGYQSPEVVGAICDFIKDRQIKGAILWSADTDLPVSHVDSLVATYKNQCS